MTVWIGRLNPGPEDSSDKLPVHPFNRYAGTDERTVHDRTDCRNRTSRSADRQFLVKHLRNYTAWRMQRLAAAGCVTIDQVPAEPTRRVFTGESVRVRLVEPPDRRASPGIGPLPLGLRGPVDPGRGQASGSHCASNGRLPVWHVGQRPSATSGSSVATLWTPSPGHRPSAGSADERADGHCCSSSRSRGALERVRVRTCLEDVPRAGRGAARSGTRGRSTCRSDARGPVGES